MAIYKPLQNVDTAPPEPSSPKITSSSQSFSSLDPDSESETASTTESTNDQSTIATASDRQHQPCLPISYNETFVQRLQGRPHVKIMPTLSIPLPESSSDEEDMDTT